MAEKSTMFLPVPFTTVPANHTYCKVNKNFTFQLLPVVYSIVFIIGFLGNCWVLAAICLTRRKWTGMTVFLFNLGMADLLYVITLPFLVVYHASQSYWNFGKVFCRITRLVFHLNLYGSIGFITCISVQRYMGIVHPLKVKGRWKHRHSVLISVLVWGLVLTQTSVDLYFPKTNANGTACFDSTMKEELQGYIKYNLTLSVTAFFTPFLIILGCYSQVVLVLIRNNSVDQELRRRCLKLVLIVTILFSLCFTPYHFLRNGNLISRYLQSQGQCIQVFKNIYLMYQVSRALASLNSVINPLIYFLGRDDMKSRIEKFGR
ncbi:P2Y purinoceptor 1-like [Carcharodon carcharias]|uniref:P2Y purinoceptor 1-like n=1 Tax=Carcharodon carcharias TaxID=13397 RepID=UPI001B7E2B10|nr:P2Y purinoceptor 1-like [Carcharodon carcharias]